MSNALYRDLKKLAEQTEKNADFSNDNYRLNFHLMPPVGWLNDPNGLCKMGEYYHVFYQYAPFDANGGVKHWGHFRSKDLITWEQLPIVMYPDQPFDVHGVYSGSALIEDDKMYLYYTGNVKLDGDFDYVNTGREHNTVLAVSSDGITVDYKKLLMKNTDYPENLTLHVRDPKVFKYENKYYMVQGARTKQDKGVLLVFESENKFDWKHINTISTPKTFGYMWECPDLFYLDGMWFLVCSPQGVTKQGNHYQNIYSCGYFPLYGDFRNDYTLGEFNELDFGFDFYAPQTFSDGQRHFMLGWLGMPDADYKNPTDDWQHCLTSLCTLKRSGNKIYRYPVIEMNALRGKEIAPQEATVFDLEYRCSQSGRIVIRNSLVIEWSEDLLSITHINGGNGRNTRKVDISNINFLRILADTSSVEIFINGGEKVLSTRYYPTNKGIILPEHGNANIWQMNSLNIVKD